MLVRLIRNIHNLPEQPLTQLRPLLLLILLLILLQLLCPLTHLVDLSLGRVLHLSDQPLFFLKGKLRVVLASGLILLLPELPILNDDGLALGGAPCFIIKFFLLL